MAKQIKTIDYDLDEDILFISNGEKVKASLDIGDFILDVNHNNLICGIEIMDASVNLGIDKETLNEIKASKCLLHIKQTMLIFCLCFLLKKGIKK